MTAGAEGVRAELREADEERSDDQRRVGWLRRWATDGYPGSSQHDQDVRATLREIDRIAAERDALAGQVAQLRIAVAREEAHCVQRQHELSAQRDAVDAALARAEQREARVRELHQPIRTITGGGTDQMCAKCRNQPITQQDIGWPCPTIAALDQRESE